MADRRSAFDAGCASLEQLHAKLHALSPYALVSQLPTDAFARERSAIATALEATKRERVGWGSEFVEQAQALLALQQLQGFCAAELATAVESAGGEAELVELAALMRQLSNMQAVGSAGLAELVRRSAQTAAAQIDAQTEQLRRAERESTELLDAAEVRTHRTHARSECPL
jgi:hypothetical protein